MRQGWGEDRAARLPVLSQSERSSCQQYCSGETLRGENREDEGRSPTEAMQWPGSVFIYMIIDRHQIPDYIIKMVACVPCALSQFRLSAPLREASR